MVEINWNFCESIDHILICMYCVFQLVWTIFGGVTLQNKKIIIMGITKF